MNRTVRVTPRALKDLDDIAEYTLEKWDAAQMDVYLRELGERFQWLAKSPQRGRLRDDVNVGYRCFRQGQHLIFFTVQEDSIDIIGVPHAAMDIGAYFDKHG